MKLSIIIPVYNAEQYLEDCVDSIGPENLPDTELILVDDGSKDASLAVCGKIQEKHGECVRIIHQENAGAAKARERGLREANGEYVWFIDSDDWIAEGSAARLLKKLDEMGPDVLCFLFKGSYEECDRGRFSVTNKKCDREPSPVITQKHDREPSPVIPIPQVRFPEGLYNKEAFEKTILPKFMYSSGFLYAGIPMSLCNKIFRKTLIERFIHTVPEGVWYGEDGLVSYQCILGAETVGISWEEAYIYRKNDSSASWTTKRLGKLKQNIPLFEAWDKVISESPYREILAPQFANYMVLVTQFGAGDVFLYHFYGASQDREKKKTLKGHLFGKYGLRALLADYAEAKQICRAPVMEKYRKMTKWNSLTLNGKVRIFLTEHRLFLLMYFMQAASHSRK